MALREGKESDEMRCLVALRAARSAFFANLVAHAQKLHSAEGQRQAPLVQEEIDLLRSDDAYQIAEFYYLIGELGLANRQRIRAYLRRHNADMQDLAKDRKRQQTMGLSPQRLEKAIFSDIQIEKVAENIVDDRLRLDQSDLGRLLAQNMSAETCRKVVVVLAKAGLLNRINIGQVMVASNGSLEGYFRDHLAQVVGALKTEEALA